MVEAVGWNWVGRVRNRDLVQRAGEQTWMSCKRFYTPATAIPINLGPVRLARSNPLACTLPVVRQPPKGRWKKSALGHAVRSAPSRKIAARERELWLIGASLGLQHYAADRIMKRYRQRMQIEKAFPDVKSERYGLGFATSHTHAPHRLAILLLIGPFVLCVLWVAGQAAMSLKLYHHYQSNTTKQRAVLSVVSLGRHILSRTPHVITMRHLGSP